MKRISNASVVMIIVTIWLIGSSGCSRMQETMTTALPRQDVTLSNGPAPTSPVETMIDTETFTAFCDRA